MKPIVAKIALAAVSLAASLGALELALAHLVSRGHLIVPPPPHTLGDFWDSTHPLFGVWHRPHSTFNHRSPCFYAEYRSNAVGARDRERERRSGAPRTVVLGDSFIEGWGLPEELRLSNLLEAQTGIEHLNFGMSHFGPYQSYLAYTHLARTFDHDTVMIGITPENDFLDLDLARASAMESYHFRYRPYLVDSGDGSGHRHYDYREGRLHRLLRRHSYTFHAAHAGMVRARALLRLAPPSTELPPGYSAFSDFSDEDFARLQKSLELLIDEAKGKRVLILLLPVLRDLHRYGRGDTDSLSKRLASLEERGDVTVVNLLPVLLTGRRDWSGYYFPCDYHWNAAANRAAAAHLRRYYPPSADP